MVMVLASEPVRKIWDSPRWDIIHSEVFNFSSFKASERDKPLLTLLPCDSRFEASDLSPEWVICAAVASQGQIQADFSLAPVPGPDIMVLVGPSLLF